MCLILNGAVLMFSGAFVDPSTLLFLKYVYYYCARRARVTRAIAAAMMVVVVVVVAGNRSSSRGMSGRLFRKQLVALKKKMFFFQACRLMKPASYFEWRHIQVVTQNLKLAQVQMESKPGCN